MLKVWLVSYSDGTEWHIFGEPEVIKALPNVVSYSYLRWVKG